MTPAQLRLSRDVCQEWDLDEFRGHICQIADEESKRQCRFEKKKQKAKHPELLEDHPRNKNG